MQLLVFGTDTIIVIMQLHLLYIFLGVFLEFVFAAFQMLGASYFLQLQFWSFSDIISHNLLGEGIVGKCLGVGTSGVWKRL